MDQNKLYDLDSLITDEDKELNGVEFQLPGGASALVARWNNTNMIKALRHKLRANRVLLESEDDFSDELTEELTIEVMAKHVLKGIKGVRFQGQEIREYSDYTADFGLKLLKVKDIRDKIQDFAKQTERYRVQQEDTAVKS